MIIKIKNQNQTKNSWNQNNIKKKIMLLLQLQILDFVLKIILHFESLLISSSITTTYIPPFFKIKEERKKLLLQHTLTCFFSFSYLKTILKSMCFSLLFHLKLLLRDFILIQKSARDFSFFFSWLCWQHLHAMIFHKNWKPEPTVLRV